MIQTLIGQKLEQSQNFLKNGKRIPVTGISVLENVVLQVKTSEKEAYSAVQLGTGSKKKPTKSLLGHAKKAGRSLAPLKTREVTLKDVKAEDMPKTGDLLNVDTVFKPGDIIQVTGISKGKGFAGVVKRYNFRGGPKTHGQSDRHRAPGSIGQGTTPGRVYKGKRMAGRMGSDTVTVRNLRVVDVDSTSNKLYVSGLIPGHRNSWVYITRIGEDKKFVPLISTKEAIASDKANAEEVKEEMSLATPPETAGEIKAAASTDSGEPASNAANAEEVKSETKEGEKKALDSEEKKEMAKTAAENAAKEKKDKVLEDTEEPKEEKDGGS